VLKLHSEPQDPDAAGWRQIEELVRLSQEKQVATFDPSAQVPWHDWMEVIALPATIGSLAHVNHIHLYGSHLRHLPPEIGRMTGLQNLDLYTS